MTIDIDIFGSVVCRDIIRHDDKKRYQVKRCINNIPITTLYESILEIPEDRLEESSLSKYDQRMLEIQGSREAVSLLKASDGKILLMDLADELLQRFFIDVDGFEKYIALEKKYAKDLESMFSKGASIKEQITQQSPLLMNLEIVEGVYKRFAEEIVQSDDNPDGYKEKHIVVVESYYTEKIVDNGTASTRNHPKEYDIKSLNELLRKLYQILYRYIPGCAVIRFPEFTHTSENHIRGVSPLSYTEETYRYQLKVLDVLSGYSKVNSVENIYKEQCLSNKLYTRMLNATSIYKINNLNKEIQALKDENKKQKEVNQRQKKYNEAQKAENVKFIQENSKLKDELTSILMAENERLKKEAKKNTT